MITLFCDPAGIRTQDHYIKSVPLYQLSYRVKLTISCYVLGLQMYDFLDKNQIFFNLILKNKLVCL